MTFRDSIVAVINRNKGLCVVISSFTCCFILWGFGSTYTIIFVYIQNDFNSSTTETGWVGSTYYGLANILAIVIAPLVKRFSYRTIVMSGVLLAGLSLLASSFVQSFHVFLVTYGVLYASGTCIGYYTTLDLVKMHYANSPYITRATCFSTMGATSGFLIQSPLVAKLLATVGWRGVLRIYGVITIIVGLVCSMFMQKPTQCCDTEKKGEAKEIFIKPENKKDQIGKTDEKEHSLCEILAYPESWYFLIGMVITSTATLFTNVNIVDFMNYIGISTYVSSWILVTAAATELIGKLMIAMFGDRMPFPKMYILALANVLFAGTMIVLIYARTPLHMILLVISLGILKSILNAMPWTASIELLGHHRNTESTVLTCVGFGIGFLSGALVGGLSYDHTGSYDVGLIVSCGMYVIGAMCFQTAPLHQKIFAPERYLLMNKKAEAVPSSKHYECIVDSYITTV